MPWPWQMFSRESDILNLVGVVRRKCVVVLSCALSCARFLGVSCCPRPSQFLFLHRSHCNIMCCANFVGSMFQHSFLAGARHRVFDCEHKIVSDQKLRSVAVAVIAVIAVIAVAVCLLLPPWSARVFCMSALMHRCCIVVQHVVVACCCCLLLLPVFVFELRFEHHWPELQDPIQCACECT